MNKWNADIIRETDTNRYRAIISFDNKPDIAVEGNGWRDFYKNVDQIAQIRFPMHKFFQWSKLSDFEQIAGIDACHVRPSCIVTKEDRRNGWKRYCFE